MTSPLTPAQFYAGLAAAPTRWAAAVLLLRYWRDHRPSAPARCSAVPVELEAWSATVTSAEHALEQRPYTVALTHEDREQILDTVGRSSPAPNNVDAMGWALNVVCGRSFGRAWSREVGSGLHTLQPGQYYPVADPGWASISAQKTPRPASTRAVADDEHPYVRVHMPSRHFTLAVHVDRLVGSALHAVLENVRQVATLHPHDAIDDFTITNTGGVVFPIHPSEDPAANAADRIKQVSAALDTGATIVVAPELSLREEATQDVLNAVAAMDRESVGLVVVGSHHDTAGRHNVLSAAITGLSTTLHHRKVSPIVNQLRIPADPARPETAGRVSTLTREGIAVPRPGELRIVQAENYRVALLVCKDFMDAQVVEVLRRAGVNAIMVAAMSETTVPFGGSASVLATQDQALSVVANGPRHWPSPVSPMGVVGQPVADRPVLSGSPAPTTRLQLFAVG